MNIINTTGMVAGCTMGQKPDGREYAVVVVKGTFTIPTDSSAPQLHAEQEPLVEADVFTGEPDSSAPQCESDYALVKPRCDVILNGSAYAPEGRPVQQVMVALRVGAMTKSFRVVGNRVWQQGMAGFSASDPEYFTVKPISYDTAFGGIDDSNPEKMLYYLTNHAGVGFHHSLGLEHIVGSPLPNTEGPDDPVTSPRGKYRPMAFGPVARAWQPRPKYAGTYDQDWIDNVFPFLPADFKDDYYQSAPSDQQIPYPRGGEEVTLANLTSEGKTTFALPRLTVPITLVDRSNERYELESVIDTVILEPDKRRFLLIWRASHPLKKNMLEVNQIQVGGISPAEPNTVEDEG